MPDLSRLRKIARIAPVTLFAWLAAGLMVTLSSQMGSPTAAWAQDPAQLEEGAQIYADNCTVCHGADGQGRVGATLAKDWPSIRPDLRIKSTIENGIAGTPMVAWSQANGGPLSTEQIDALVAYILSWESGGPRVIAPTPTFVPARTYMPIPDVEGDPNKGAVLFVQNCAVCHGESGQGRVGANLSKNFASIRPDLSVKTTIANGIAGSPMPAWSQANGGPLTEAEINDLTSYVLVLPVSSQVTQVVLATQTPAPLNPWLSGWGGIVLGVVTLILLVVFILWFQSRRKA